jgi:hypothetical protein
VQQSVRIGFVDFDVQFEGSATAVTEVTGREIICGAGYVACRDLSYSEGLRGVVTECVCTYCHIYTGHNCEGHRNIKGVGRCMEGSVP